MPYKSLTSLAKSITLELWYLLMRLRVVIIISKRVSWYSVCEKSWDSSLYLVEHAAEVREKRPPEPYKGKGIKYVDEVIRRKVGKTGAKK